jgi:hypothetical protein
MNSKKLLAAFIVLMLASLACGLGSGTEEAASSEPTAVVETSSSGEGSENTGDTTGDDSSDGGDSGDAGSTDSGTTEEGSSTESGGDDTGDGSDAGPGPESVNLDEALRGRDVLASYDELVILQWDGTTPDGAAASFALDNALRFRDVPEGAVSLTMITRGIDGSESLLDSSTIGPDHYIFYDEQGCTITASEANQLPLDEFFQLELPLLGTANLVESGLDINGVLSDQYELSADNIANDPDSGVTPETFLFEEGHVYIARDDGYVTRMEIHGQFADDPSSLGFDPEQPVSALMSVNSYPSDADVLPPAGCAGETPGTTDYPVMDDAEGYFDLPDGIFYNITTNLDVVTDFYKAQMPEFGWTLDSESQVGSFVEQLWSKDGMTVAVRLVQNGDVVAVTIEEVGSEE